jgi:formate hydrogenlyase subunit 3/multisubunit Na+/H+ antiporter MnhD subunit
VLWLRLGALLFVVVGLVAEVALLVTDEGSVTLDAVGITFAISTPARLVLVATNVALFCAAIVAWTGEDDSYSPNPEWGLLLSAVMSSLLAAAALVTERIVAALFLFGAALAVAALSLARPRSAIQRADDADNLHVQTLLARRIAGGLKHLGLATLATGFLIVGVVLVERYAFNLENRGLLQLGLSLLAIGVIVRAGSMPFAAASADTIEAAPSAALMMLGAATPVVLLVGLITFAPIDGTVARQAGTAWLGAAGTLLAGLRALGVLLERRVGPADSEPNTEPLTRWTAAEANLIAMTVAAPVGWAIFGILSGSRMGAVGAILIAANMALALPIVVMGRKWATVGVLSLLGLPPFGGFVGTIMVASSAANTGGVWLGLLLVGTALVGAGWLAITTRNRLTGQTSVGWREWITNPAYLIPTLLVILQLVLFVASFSLANELSKWATIPWLTAP